MILHIWAIDLVARLVGTAGAGLLVGLIFGIGIDLARAFS